MKKIFAMFFGCLIMAGANAATFTSCGPGYILASHSRVDGIDAAECQKLWCRDLETGKEMGTGTRAASGYKVTNSPQTLCDANNNCIECFGERKWCAGETAGIWNPEYGTYTRGGGDSVTYTSYQKGSCFAWRLGKPTCGDGETAVLKNGEWVCTTASGSDGPNRASSIRRTGTTRRIIR